MSNTASRGALATASLRLAGTDGMSNIAARACARSCIGSKMLATVNPALRYAGRWASRTIPPAPIKMIGCIFAGAFSFKRVKERSSIQPIKQYFANKTHKKNSNSTKHTACKVRAWQSAYYSPKGGWPMRLGSYACRAGSLSSGTNASQDLIGSGSDNVDAVSKCKVTICCGRIRKL
jgi:hypothetical protein